MQVVSRRVIVAGRTPFARWPCRVVAGRRHALPGRLHRNFHASAVAYEEPKDPNDPAAVATSKGETANSDEPSQPQTDLKAPEAARDNGQVSAEVSEAAQRAKPRDKGFMRRSVRNFKQADPPSLPPVVLPEAFLDRNVRCAGEAADSQKIELSDAHNDPADAPPSVSAEESTPEASIDDVPSSEAVTELPSLAEPKGDDVTPAPTSSYIIHPDVYEEVLTTLRASVNLPIPSDIDVEQAQKPNVVLYCPKDSGTVFLNHVVERAAKDLDVDLVRIGPDDIAELVGPYLGENIAFTRSKVSMIGFESHGMVGKIEDWSKEEEGEEEEDGGEEMSPLGPLRGLLGSGKIRPYKPSSSTVITLGQQVMDQFSNPEKSLNAKVFGLSEGPPPESFPEAMKLANALRQIIKAPTVKRKGVSPSLNPTDTTNPPAESQSESEGLIIQVQELGNFQYTSNKIGRRIMKTLREIVKQDWAKGQKVAIVETTIDDPKGGETPLSRNEIRQLQSDAESVGKPIIFVPPDRSEAQKDVFMDDDLRLTRAINIRHVEEMIRRLLAGTPSESNPRIDLAQDLESLPENGALIADMEEHVWRASKCMRIASFIVGQAKAADTVIGASALLRAFDVLASSDEVKFEWGAAERRARDMEEETFWSDSSSSVSSKANLAKEKIAGVKSRATHHEKKLLGGLINPADIKTTFDHIRAPPETVEALKTLTSLSLLRPDAFSYGVLSSDKIPGCLLYGPPGTGKTLLAKAVAKESGATVLEVSGSEVYDMYVGEGEKNIKAIFSLAKKLSPCIVFIDEADAIFGARGGDSKRSSHRELINQFLREWDGMNDLSAFIMVATNRPFDLDEAVLRRLPRRLLVDLPLQDDREAILKIHLRDEVLADSVELSKIAADTPFYSGSDLKNLSVAAALACVREENADAAKWEGEGKYVYPEKRVLEKRHFDIALKEISASISEDMSTLSAIRKFDEKYGDRKGRRKRGVGLGFGGTRLPEKDSEAGRVRKGSSEVE